MPPTSGLRDHPFSMAGKPLTTSLESGVDVTVIALWLGHEQVETTYRVYLHADLSLKQRALARTAPAGTTTGRYRAPDALLAFLERL